MVALIAFANESLGIAGLEILSARRLNIHHGVVAATNGAAVVWTESAIETGWTSLVDVLILAVIQAG